MDEIVALHRVALEDFDRMVEGMEPSVLPLATPCTAWAVVDLLAHSLGQHRGFATSVSLGDADRAAYAPVPWSPATWRTSIVELLAAFAAADLSAAIHQVELRPGERIPTRFVVGAQLLDSAVHAWDLARALGQPYQPTAAVVTAVVGMARLIPDGDNRGAGGAFEHALPIVRSPADPGDAGDETWNEALRLLGRDPSWRQPPLADQNPPCRAPILNRT